MSVPDGLIVEERVGGDWAVLHQSSGLAVVFNCDDRSQAERVAEELVDVADWTGAADELRTDGHVHRAVLAEQTRVDVGHYRPARKRKVAT